MSQRRFLLAMGWALALTGAAAAAPTGGRGADGELRLVFWQGPTLLNPYLTDGSKDIEAASLVLEPLAGFDPQGAPVPRLVTEIPTVENGGVAPDFTAITWTLRPGLLWSDGTPVTAEDVAFSARYCMEPAGGCAQLARFEGIDRVEALDAQRLRITFKAPKYNPYMAFVGAASPVLQKAQFASCLGAAADDCVAANQRPIGTGPFVVTAFAPGAEVRLAANPAYRDPAKPAFATVTLQGGGDVAAAARAVLETGAADYAWNTQLAPDVLAGMEAAGLGKVISGFGGFVERLEMNLTDPAPTLPEAERSTPGHPHPILSDLRVRRALALAIDRAALVDVGYGPAGRPTCSLIPPPDPAAGDCPRPSLKEARALLEEAGWTDSDGDGIRDRKGKRLRLVFLSSVNAVRQDVQGLIKGWWAQIGVDTEIRTIDGGVLFGGDPASPDTLQRFPGDVVLYADSQDGTDPEPYLARYACAKAPRPETGWRGENISRFCDPAFDALIEELGKTGKPERRAEIVRKMNDMLTRTTDVIVPLVDRGRLSAQALTLGGVAMNTWDSELWNAADWYRIK